MSERMSGRRTIRVGVIGAGVGAALHIVGFQSCPEVEVVAVCGRTEGKVKAVAERFGIPRIVSDYRQLLQDVDVVSVATPNVLHYPMVMASLEAGKHVFCEKPLGMSVRQAKEMYERAERSGLKHCCGLPSRYLPAIAKAKELLDQGFVGRILQISVESLPAFPPTTPMGWRSVRGLSGTGVLAETGPHMLDRARYLLGRELKGVFGLTSTFVPVRPKTSEVYDFLDGVRWGIAQQGAHSQAAETSPVDVEDDCLILGEYEGSVSASFHFSWHVRSAHTPRSDYTGVQIYGDQGTLLIETVRPDGRILGVRVGGGPPEEIHFPLEPGGQSSPPLDRVERWQLSMNRLVQRFVGAIDGGPKDYPTFYDGLKIQEVLDGVAKSAEQRRWVRLDAKAELNQQRRRVR